ncbi:Ferritin Dps family protein [Denitrovibrio acetiphilus DSM 12809]|jgi:bacterioferritin|uniref:Bacterioferritin n=1 Tax=Denitrovibrio acetiphilus (strain DSM 12809 / NBRC 114555 / N2460) TaxID=522772 RepID=D4H3J7_DENA2|nr:bacterioferritin [Denitrovibrio acetiphilus]ADD69099.1 Ferritin Dps family protein [Denitrovibrio acetiphilus DSM 12809]
MRKKFTKSIELLNKSVADEIAALHQYMYFHFHCDDQGYDLLAGLFRRIAIEEMMHVEKLAERILFLDGDVIMKAESDVIPEKDVKKMLDMAREMEDHASEMYNTFANECSKASDSVTKTLFESLVVDEERHYDNFDDELENMDRFGENYLTLQAIERAKTRGGGQPA